MNLISRAPLHAGNRGAQWRRGREGGTHFDVKRGAPGPLPRSTRRYCYYEPGSLLIIKKEPEVAACDTTGALQASRRVREGETRWVAADGDDSTREMTDIPRDATCVSPINAFIKHMTDFQFELIERISDCEFMFSLARDRLS